MIRFFFFATFFISALFFSAPDKKDFVSDPVHSHADTARVDSLVRWIDTKIADQESDRIVSKKFACEYSGDSGEVVVYYQRKTVISLTLHDCGTDHGSSDFEASFIGGKLVYYFSASYVWSFDGTLIDDSICCGTYDETNSSACYYHNGTEIKEIRKHDLVHNYSQESESSEGALYFFDGDGESANAGDLQKWVDFAHSKKSYEEFFKDK